MAQRRTLDSPAIGALPSGRRPQSEKPRPVPSGPGNLGGDFGEVAKGLATVGKAARHHGNPIAPALPCPYQFGPRFDPAGQFQTAVGFYHGRLHELIKQAPCRGRETAIDFLLDTVGDAPPQQIRTEGLWWLSPE